MAGDQACGQPDFLVILQHFIVDATVHATLTTGISK